MKRCILLLLTILMAACKKPPEPGPYTQTLSAFTCAPVSVGAGSASSCTATISAAAGTSGFPITITTTGTGITAPKSVTVGWTSSKVTFNVTTTASTPAQSATITASAGTVKIPAGISVVASAAITYTITALTCTPAKLIPGESTSCTGTLSPAAPLSGLAASITSSSANLPVPASVSIPGNSSSFKFSSTASALATGIENDTITATVAGATKTVAVTIDPSAKFQFRLTATEMPSLMDSAVVTPVIKPTGWSGALTVRGAGTVTLSSTGSGASFAAAGNQNTDTAYVNFTSGSFGTVFNNSSEISCYLKSAYSFAERQALPSPNMRSAFEIYDANGSWWSLNTYTSTDNMLRIGFGAKGYAAVYAIPAGTEDTVFGKGVTMKLRITWDASSFSLWVNGQQVQTNSITQPKAPSWGTTSAFTIGARNVRLNGGGFYSCDDTVAEFMMR